MSLGRMPSGAKFPFSWKRRSLDRAGDDEKQEFFARTWWGEYFLKVRTVRAPLAIIKIVIIVQSQ